MTMQPEWWEHFFQGMVADFWRVAIPEEHTRTEVNFLEKLLQLPPRSKILDVPCGQGRHALELASRNYQMTGVDFSPGFLDEARAKASARRLEIAWECRDMRALPWRDEYDGAFCLGGSFGYFDDEGNAAFLRSVARALKPGGRFVLDATRIAEFVLPRFREREWSQAGDFLFLEENHYDPAQGRMQTEYTLVRDCRREKKSDSVRIYTYRELAGLLKESGFGQLEGFGSFEREPYQLGSEMLYIVATR